ncbi:MAG: MauE/DoxX family redox-associated membrane protein [Aridibacter sp.]
MEILLLIIRLFLFGIFALAGIGKLLDLEGSEKAVKSFGVPENLAKSASILLPIAEIGIAILLLFTQTSWFGAIGGFLLLLVFIGGMFWQMKQGNAPDCHCFGQIHSEPVSVKSLLRNIAFAVLALFLVVSGKENQGLNITNSVGGETEIMQIIFGVVIVGFLFGVLYYLKKITEQQTQILRRIEVIELLSHDGGREVERDGVENPKVGLPIGSPVPEFNLKDITEKQVALTSVFLNSKPTLLFFVSPDCGPCESLIPKVEEWQKELNNRVNFAFISSGTAKENLAKFGGDSFKTILLQEDREVADALEAKWTPTALLINAGGTIASKIAAGDTDIENIIEKIREDDFADGLIFVPGEEDSEMKLGGIIPEFSLKDLNGQEITNENLKGKKTLVAYWSATCPHCVNMLDELRDWDKAKGQDEPNLILLSSGDEETHKEFNMRSPILLEEKGKIAQEFGMNGTPSAVLVNEDGKIVSETAVGAANIWTLLGRKKQITN